ncbi:MAG TPA: hypothetical protein VNO30_23655 [Kofleriaceae bacterium]|nr:hypothetical protein [Kofleriaceae bacterium]
MATRPGSNVSVSTADVLIAMLSSDLRGSWAERGAPRRRERGTPVASVPSPPPPAFDEEPAAPDEPAASAGPTG